MEGIRGRTVIPLKYRGTPFIEPNSRISAEGPAGRAEVQVRARDEAIRCPIYRRQSDSENRFHQSKDRDLDSCVEDPVRKG